MWRADANAHGHISVDHLAQLGLGMPQLVVQPSGTSLEGNRRIVLDEWLCNAQFSELLLLIAC